MTNKKERIGKPLLMHANHREEVDEARTGDILAIGGLKEKTMAALRAGVRTVLIPAENEADLAEIDPTVRAGLDFVPTDHVDKVLDLALLPKEAHGEETRGALPIPAAGERAGVRQ